MVDDDLAQIEHILLRASDDVLDSAALSLVYWRERLRQIKDGEQLPQTHLEMADALLVMLDRWLTSGSGNGRTHLAWDKGYRAKRTQNRGLE